MIKTTWYLVDEFEFHKDRKEIDWENLTIKEKVMFYEKYKFGQVELYGGFLNIIHNNIDKKLIMLFKDNNEIYNTELPMWGNKTRDFADEHSDLLEKAKEIMVTEINKVCDVNPTFENLLQSKENLENKHSKAFYYGQIINFIQYFVNNEPCGNVSAILQQTFYNECGYPQEYSNSYK